MSDVCLMYMQVQMPENGTKNSKHQSTADVFIR